jgi:hypothetical protein
MISLADMIDKGAVAGDSFRLSGFAPERHVHTYDGEALKRPEGWVEGAEVVFVGWRETAFLRRAQFSVDGVVWSGKGLASCLLVDHEDDSLET